MVLITCNNLQQQTKYHFHEKLHHLHHTQFGNSSCVFYPIKTLPTNKFERKLVMESKIKPIRQNLNTNIPEHKIVYCIYIYFCTAQ